MSLANMKSANCWFKIDTKRTLNELNEWLVVPYTYPRINNWIKTSRPWRTQKRRRSRKKILFSFSPLIFSGLKFHNFMHEIHVLCINTFNLFTLQIVSSFLLLTLKLHANSWRQWLFVLHRLFFVLKLSKVKFDFVWAKSDLIFQKRNFHSDILWQECWFKWFFFSQT